MRTSKTPAERGANALQQAHDATEIRPGDDVTVDGKPYRVASIIYATDRNGAPGDLALGAQMVDDVRQVEAHTPLDARASCQQGSASTVSREASDFMSLAP